jgi:hypothetical protein
MKKLLFLFFIYFSTFVYSEEIKLQCQSNVVRTLNYKLFDNKSGIELIQINTISNIVLFRLTGIFQGTVQVAEDPDWKYINNSDSNRWDVENIQTKPEKGYKGIQIRLILDRNTGLLDYTKSLRSTNDEYVEIKLTGICSKVDTTQKKF